MKKQKLLEGEKTFSTIYYHILSSLKDDTEKFGVQDIYQGSTPVKGREGMEKQEEGRGINHISDAGLTSQPTW